MWKDKVPVRKEVDQARCETRNVSRLINKGTARTKNNFDAVIKKGDRIRGEAFRSTKLLLQAFPLHSPAPNIATAHLLFYTVKQRHNPFQFTSAPEIRKIGSCLVSSRNCSPRGILARPLSFFNFSNLCLCSSSS